MYPPYTVALVAAVELPPATRTEAETRFARTLDDAFGGPEQVVAALMAWNAASECAPHELQLDAITRAARWARVTHQAREAGMRSLGPVPGARFEVKLPR